MASDSDNSIAHQQTTQAIASDSDNSISSQQDIQNSVPMDNLRPCVQQLDATCMPQLLDQVSEVPENDSPRQFAISVYTQLAQAHKQDIVPYIPRIMASVIRSFPLRGGSPELHDACAKVVSSVARFTVDPNNRIERNQGILCGLCTPLLSAICNKPEVSVAAGAARCLRALVESEKWKYADSELRCYICSIISSIIVERGVQAVSLLYLLKSLTKFCADAAQRHAQQWLNLGLECLKRKDLSISASMQHRMAAAQLVSSILKASNVQNLGLDLQTAKEVLLANQIDRIPGVRAAIAEALEALGEQGQSFDVMSDHSSPIRAESFQSWRRQIRKNSLSMEEASLQSLADFLPSPYSAHEDSSALRTNRARKHLASYRVKHAAKGTSRDSSDSPNLSSARDDSSAASLEWPSARTRIPANVACLPRSISLDFHNKARSSAMPDSTMFGFHENLDNAFNDGDDCSPTNDSGISCSISNDETEGESKSFANFRFGKSGDNDGNSWKENNENKHEMPFHSECSMDDVNKTVRQADDVLCNGCTEILLTPDGKENDNTSEKQDAKTGHQIPVGDFIFTTPRRLLHALQSGDVKEMSKKGGDDALHEIKSSTARTERDIITPTCQVSPSSSCCTSEGIKLSEGNESRPQRRRLQSRSRHVNCKCLCKLLDDCQVQVSGDSPRGCSSNDLLAGDDEAIRKASELLQRCLSSMDGQRVTRLSVDHKVGDHEPHYTHPKLTKMENSASSNSIRRASYRILAVGIVIVAIVLYLQMHQSQELHALVPT